MAQKIKLLPALLVFILLGGCMTAHTDIPLEELNSTSSPSALSSSPPSKQPSGSDPSSQEAVQSVPEEVRSQAPEEAGFTPYQAPEFARADFDPDAAQGANGVLMDLSGTEKGYVAVSAIGDARMKFRVEMGEKIYDYDLPSDGTPTVYPLQSGDGSYILRALTNTVGTKYAEAYSVETQVQLEDEFQPFLRPSQYVDYSEDSSCVKIAAELAAKEPDALGVVDAVFEYICSNVTYDKEKAAGIKKGYLPSPDETLSSGKGICFDYASLAAAMLRSQGIPTKMVFGNVQPNDLYHAWNMFYTDESGWVTVGYEVESNSWSRLDLTFSANGGDTEFIGDGTNYADMYYY